jgi:fatty acid-binding protein DegV
MEMKLVVEVLFAQEQLEWLVNAFSGLPRTPQHLEAIEEDLEDLRKRMEILRSANDLSDLEGQERVERQIIADEEREFYENDPDYQDDDGEAVE